MLNYIWDITFPKQCINCSAWNLYICINCQQQLKMTVEQRCIVCQLPSRYGFTHEYCHTNDSPDRLTTIFDYRDKLVSKIINTTKLALVSELVTELSLVAVNKIGVENMEINNFVLCPIPMTRLKRRFRGFNQSELITKVFAQELNLPIDPLVAKSRSTKQQKVLNKEQRQKNLQSSFKILYPESIPSNVILIDDVSTTGSTFIEVAKTLKTAGVKNVWCLALAQD